MELPFPNNFYHENASVEFQPERIWIYNWYNALLNTLFDSHCGSNVLQVPQPPTSVGHTTLKW